MHNRHVNLSPALAAGITMLLLAGCAPLQQQVDTPVTPTVARQKAAQGDHEAASRAYLDLALGATGMQRERYLIFAAGELFIANDIENANRILSQVGTDVNPQNLDVWAEVTALIRLSEGNPQAALDALNRVSATPDPGAAARILRLRADALFRLNRPEAAVATLLQREALLRPRDVSNNHRLIWSGMQQTGAYLPQQPSGRGDPVLAGWLELGAIAYRERASVSSMRSGIEAWRARNPQHPASRALVDEILANLQSFSQFPERVAVLLPLSGEQQGIGESIRDGMLAAHFALSADSARPQLRFFDTARSGAEAAFQQAVLGGADFVVGPLFKQEIAGVAKLAETSAIPTLALNYAADDFIAPPAFYQFALAPEDEARGVAIRATDEGMYNAVALVPASDWGERVLDAFASELQARGGKLLAARAYPPDAPDFSASIQEILLLDESYARRKRLAANIGKQLEFEPRRRQDVDLVFVAANASVAKLIRPQLKFHYAGDIPTFATSAVYLPGSSDNSDLDGIAFPDIPWLLNPGKTLAQDQATLQRHWGAGTLRRARFYAMGYDAYHLTSVLNGRAATGTTAMEGKTGNLYMDEQGRLHRELDWARMERGRPRALPDIIQGLSQDAEVTLSNR